MRREPNDLKDKKKKKKKPAKKVKPANGESGTANGEASAQPGTGRVRRRDKLLQSLTALVGAKGDGARAGAEPRTPGYPSGSNGHSTISTIEEEEEEEDEDVVEERRLAAKRSEAAERILARLNSGPPPPPGTPAHSVASSSSSSRSHRPSPSPRPNQPGAAQGGPGPAPVAGLGLPPKARHNANRNRDGPPPAASARFAAMSAAASGHPKYGAPGPGSVSGHRTGQGSGLSAGSPSPWANPGAHVVDPPGFSQGSAARGPSQGRRPQHVRYASLDEAAAAVLQRAGSFSQPASAVDPRAALGSPALSGFSLQFAGGRPGSSSGAPELPRLGTAQSRSQLSSRGSMRGDIEDDLVSEADQESVMGYDDDTGFPLLQGGTAHVLVIPEEGEAVHGKIDTRHVEAERPLDLSHFRRVLSFVYGDEPSPMDGLKIREVDKIMLAVHGMEGLVTDDEGGDGSSDGSEEESEGEEEEEGAEEEEEDEEEESEGEEEEEGGKEGAGGGTKGGKDEGIDQRMRDPLLREILTKELLRFLAETPGTHPSQTQPQSQVQLPGARARPATADGRFHGTSAHGMMPRRSGESSAGKGGTNSQLSVSAKEGRDLDCAGQGEEGSGETSRQDGGGGGKGEAEGGRHRRTGSLDLRTEIARLSGEDALRILMSARESFQRTVEEQAHNPTRRGHVRASSLLAGEALEDNLVRGITRVYSQQGMCSAITEEDKQEVFDGAMPPGAGEGSGRGAQPARRHGAHGGAKKGVAYGQRMGRIQESDAESDTAWEWERGHGGKGEGGGERGRGWESDGWESDGWKREKEGERERGRAWESDNQREWDTRSEGDGTYSSSQQHWTPSSMHPGGPMPPAEGQWQGEGGHRWGPAHHRQAPAPGPEFREEPAERSLQDKLNARHAPKQPGNAGRDGPQGQAQAYAPPPGGLPLGAPQEGQSQQRRGKERGVRPAETTWPLEDHGGRQGGMVAGAPGPIPYNDSNTQYRDSEKLYSDSEQLYSGQQRSARQHDDSAQRGRGQGRDMAEARDWGSDSDGGWRPESAHSGLGGGRSARGTPADGAAYHQRGYGREEDSSDDGWGTSSSRERRRLGTPPDGRWDSEASRSDGHGFHSTTSGGGNTSNRSTSSDSSAGGRDAWGGGAPGSSQWGAQGQGQRGPHEWPQEARHSPSPDSWPQPPPGGFPAHPAHTGGGANGMPQQRGQGPSREWAQQRGTREEGRGRGRGEEEEGQRGSREWPERGGQRPSGVPQAAWPEQETRPRSDGGWDSGRGWEAGGQPGNSHRAPSPEYRGSAGELTSVPKAQGSRHKASHSDHSDQGSYVMNGGQYGGQDPHHTKRV